MESLFQQFSHLDILPVFMNVLPSVAQPFVHGYQAVAEAFAPFTRDLSGNETGLLGGMIFVLLSYAFALLVQDPKKSRVVVTNRKPSTVYREGFPSSLKSGSGF